VTPLERALHERIRAEGPISVEAYMEACNEYYYATRDPFGVGGDFTTAPEVSQMFGEMIGAALVDCWTRAGAPAEAIYAELGPGRGTLAADALRVMRGAGFQGQPHFVETSPVLREAQAQAVPDACWHISVEELPERPFLLVANEFFDALPIRQQAGGMDRHVIIAGRALAFDRGGDLVETSPARDEAVAAIARRLAANGGMALIVDYGHEVSAPGDTLQAVRDHQFAPILERPGEQDITAHVDFETVMNVARSAGAEVTRVALQGHWLRQLGIAARAQVLADQNPERAADIEAALHRLTAPDAMGQLFKVIALHSPDWPSPAGLA
jgi:SAM-dependent MidA family methyltransferase